MLISYTLRCNVRHDVNKYWDANISMMDVGFLRLVLRLVVLHLFLTFFHKQWFCIVSHHIFCDLLFLAEIIKNKMSSTNNFGSDMFYFHIAKAVQVL